MSLSFDNYAIYLKKGYKTVDSHVSVDQTRQKVCEQGFILINAVDDNAVFVGGLIVDGLIVWHRKLISQFVLLK
jgi:hypothetical protein